mmetsp:Transcript_21729/g.30477  ORF Transcript_21729/g.30477 Transcript_21729/m.30477 type:complete len:95 (-) Transcript_21729:316-600(-)
MKPIQFESDDDYETYDGCESLSDIKLRSTDFECIDHKFNREKNLKTYVGHREKFSVKVRDKSKLMYKPYKHLKPRQKHERVEDIASLIIGACVD